MIAGEASARFLGRPPLLSKVRASSPDTISDTIQTALSSMPRQQKRGAAATIPARGKKTTFEGADDVEEHQPIASSSRISTPSVELEEADSDDDAPEAVSVTHTKGQGIRPDETYASR